MCQQVRRTWRMCCSAWAHSRPRGKSQVLRSNTTVIAIDMTDTGCRCGRTWQTCCSAWAQGGMKKRRKLSSSSAAGRAWRCRLPALTSSRSSRPRYAEQLCSLRTRDVISWLSKPHPSTQCQCMVCMVSWSSLSTKSRHTVTCTWLHPDAPANVQVGEVKPAAVTADVVINTHGALT